VVGRGRTGGVEKVFRLNDCESSLVGGGRRGGGRLLSGFAGGNIGRIGGDGAG
jgi:hypothetical protein